MSTIVITSPVYGVNGQVYHINGTGPLVAGAGGPGITLNGGTLINESNIIGGDAGPGSYYIPVLGGGGTGVILTPQTGGTEPVTVNGSFQGYFGGQLLNYGTIIGGHDGYPTNGRMAYGGVGVAVGSGDFLSNNGLIKAPTMAPVSMCNAAPWR